MKQISDDDFNKELKSKANIRLMNVAAKSYNRILGRAIESYKAEALWQSLRRFDPSRGMRFSTYLYQMVRRKCYYEANRIKNVKKRDEKIFSYRPAINSQTNNTLIFDILNSLPEKEAKLLSDRFIYNKTLLEISKENDVSIPNIHQRLKVLKKKIKTILTA